MRVNRREALLPLISFSVLFRDCLLKAASVSFDPSLDAGDRKYIKVFTLNYDGEKVTVQLASDKEIEAALRIYNSKIDKEEIKQTIEKFKKKAEDTNKRISEKKLQILKPKDRRKEKFVFAPPKPLSSDEALNRYLEIKFGCPMILISSPKNYLNIDINSAEVIWYKEPNGELKNVISFIGTIPRDPKEPEGERVEQRMIVPIYVPVLIIKDDKEVYFYDDKRFGASGNQT